MIVDRSPEVSLVNAPMQNSLPSGSAMVSPSPGEPLRQSTAAKINDQAGRRFNVLDCEVEVHSVLHMARLIDSLHHKRRARPQFSYCQIAAAAAGCAESHAQQPAPEGG